MTAKPPAPGVAAIALMTGGILSRVVKELGAAGGVGIVVEFEALSTEVTR